jgi:hypothetical protein
MASIKYDADYSDADVVALLLGIGLHGMFGSFAIS